MTDWDPDYADYFDSLLQEEDPFGPYDEDDSYSKRPLPGEQTQAAGFNHHPECTTPDGNMWDESCNCRALYERDYHETKEREAEEEYEERWG